MVQPLSAAPKPRMPVRRVCEAPTELVLTIGGLFVGMMTPDLILPPQHGRLPVHRRPSRALWVALIVSLSLHGAVLLLFSQHSARPVAKTAPPIKARLIIPVRQPQPITLSATPEASPAPSPKQQDVPPDTEPVSTEPLRAESAPVEVAPQPPASQQTQADTSSERNREAGRFNPRAALNQYMSEYDAARQQQDSRQAAEDFRRVRRSPVLIDPRASSEPDAVPGAVKPTIVNCDSAVNKTIAVLSGITGGTLTCSERSNIDGYIRERIKNNSQKREQK